MNINSGKTHYSINSCRCCAGNPSIDSRGFHEPTPDDMDDHPWMICRQSRHTRKTKAALTLAKLEELYLPSLEALTGNMYEKYETRVAPFRRKYRCVYGVVTVRAVSNADISKFIFGSTHARFLVCQANLTQYFSPSLASFLIINE